MQKGLMGTVPALLVSALLASFGQCEQSTPAAPAPSAPVPQWNPDVRGEMAQPVGTLRVGYLPATHDTLLFVAAAEGLVERQGVKVDMREYKNSPDALRALEAGEVDVAIPGIAAPMYRIAAGSDLAIVGGAAWYSAAIVCPKDLASKISIGTDNAVQLLKAL
ncbi:MAG: ABC transporter substrate-binding protein [Planctomycetes bacterium]|nr:ABC transporter substrate-binding protein [Planctomycetota bacterium]